MEKVLNQDEIDAMFRAALGRSQGPASAVPSYQVCDFKQAGQIKKDQVRAISNLHEGFARNLTNALGAYLRVIFEVNLVSVEQLTFREFLQRIPDLAYLATFQVKPMGAIAALDLEPSLVFPIIDLLLGGIGRMNEQEREITEIEEGILRALSAFSVASCRLPGLHSVPRSSSMNVCSPLNCNVSCRPAIKLSASALKFTCLSRRAS